MCDLSVYKGLANVPGYANMMRKILSCADRRQKKDFVNQLRIANKLNDICGLEITGIGYGQPEKDILFKYKNEQYAAEIKTMHLDTKDENKKLNEPPFTVEVKDSTNVSSKGLLPEMPRPDYFKEIADKITEAYGQLTQDCLNIIFLVVEEAWWLDECDAEMGWRLFLEGREPEKLKKLNAVVFCGGDDSDCMVFETLGAKKIAPELKPCFQRILFE